MLSISRNFRESLKNPWILVAVFWLLISIVLLRVLIVTSVSDDVIFGNDSGGQSATFVLALVALVPFFVVSLRIAVPMFIPIAMAIFGGVLAALFTLLIQVGWNNVAWSLYGGLKVLRAPEIFNDLAWTLRWVACDGCDAEATNHGVGLLWLKPMTLGQINGYWAIPIGFLGILVMSLALVWLAKESQPVGKLLISIAAVSSAWLLLLDRANLDILVFLLPIVSVFLYRRSTGYLGWAVFALIIWWVGTWKYYPFVLGISLLPAISLRRGWIILASFIGAAFAYLALQMSAILEDLSINSSVVYLDDFPGFGRIPIIARITNEFSLGQEPIWSNLLLLVLATVALLWGYRVSHLVKAAPIEFPLLSLVGSLIFLTNTFIAGFGFGYKGAFLLLAVPLVSLLMKRPDRFMLYTGIVLVALLTISLLVTYSILLTSLASIFASFIILGISLGVLMRAKSGLFSIAKHSNTG